MSPGKLSDHQAEVAVNRRLLGLFDDASLAEPNPVLPLRVGDWVSTSRGKVLMEADVDVITATLHVEVWDAPLPDDDTWPRTKTVPMVLESGNLSVDEIEHGTRSLGIRVPAPGLWQARLSWRTEDSRHATVRVQFWPVSGRAGTPNSS
ncbi:hypothetical protein SAMN05216188_13042 [Lentzea xinjiangensis]|uniref:Uncharacterized protein n=1 Tax=Lentzea xinjiangensis TaxID=402600 RepID=A0A1H9W2Z0_9PSEU|nr:hypothetical protein [Lentzea xinjiangensis]SES28296.1 hypothetical protein SAMN05216188_13042 [Lentzea xinjiangensis]